MKFPIYNNSSRGGCALGAQFPKVAVAGVSILYVILFLWLFHRHFSPLGQWSAEIEAPAAKTRLISGPTPQLRVEVDDAQEVWRVNETPVYFEVNNPKKFDQAELGVKFRGNVSIVEAGVVKSQDPWRVEKRVLYHKYLEALQWPWISGNPLPSSLPSRREGLPQPVSLTPTLSRGERRIEADRGGLKRGEGDDLILWQRTPRYASVQEFLENPPAVEEVAVVDTVAQITKLQNYEITNSIRRYDVSLRGSQDIYLYTAGEDIEVKFLFQDMNRHDGEDGVEVRLYRHNSPEPPLTLRGGNWEVVDHATLGDDGIVWGNRESKPPREFTVSHRQSQPGVYRLQVFTTDDVFIRSITATQQKMVWKNTLYLGDEVGYRDGAQPVTVYSNGQGYALRTPHPESVQKVVFSPPSGGAPPLGGENRRQGLEIAEHNKQYSIQMPREIAGDVLAVTVPKRDTVLTTDGFFALSPDAFFLPEPISYMSDLDLSRLGINYVLARYEKTKQGGDGWHEGSIRTSIHDIDQTVPLQFFIGVPHGTMQSMELAHVKVNLEKPRLIPRLKMALARSTTWSYLKHKFISE